MKPKQKDKSKTATGRPTQPSWQEMNRKQRREMVRKIQSEELMLGENSEVFVANANGSEARSLTNDPAFDGWPAWSPDGSKIAFASNPGTQLRNLHHESGRERATEGRGNRGSCHRAEVVEGRQDDLLHKLFQGGFRVRLPGICRTSRCI